MPLRKNHHLYQLCVENILQNASFWLQIKHGYQKNGLPGGPFDCLPPCVEQDLLDAYMQLHGLPGRSNVWLEGQDKWRLFITRSITTLTITEFTDKISLVHIAATCRNLKHLEMKNIQEALPYLKSVSPCLTTLISLNFETMAHVTSGALKYIKKHCPNLRVLVLKSCFLNDKALSHLKHVPTLSELDLRDTEVTSSGVCNVLRHNPQLVVLRHPDVVRAVFKLHGAKPWPMRSDVAARYRIRDIDLVLTCRDNAALLSAVAAVCPDIERVRVELDVCTSPDSLTPLALLKHLTDLDVQCVAHSGKKPWDEPKPSTQQITLFEGILPLLASRGSTLVAISLEGVSGVNMRVIEEQCTHLVSLGLFYNTYAHDSFPTDTKPFPTLRRLLFGSNSGRDEFPAWYLERLLSNRGLEELSLSGSPLLTQDLFARAFESTSAFPRLRRLELDYCNMAAEVVTEFLLHCGKKSLRELSICGPFVREQASQALCYIVCEKLDVQLEAYYYSFIKMKKRMVRYKQDVNIFGSTRRSLGDNNFQRNSPEIVRLSNSWGESQC